MTIVGHDPVRVGFPCQVCTTARNDSNEGAKGRLVGSLEAEGKRVVSRDTDAEPSAEDQRCLSAQSMTTMLDCHAASKDLKTFRKGVIP
jgi:hypothetical protein